MHPLGWFVDESRCLIPVAQIVESGQVMAIKFFINDSGKVLISDDVVHVNEKRFFGSPNEAFKFIDAAPFWYLNRDDLIIYPIKKIEEAKGFGSVVFSEGNKVMFLVEPEKNLFSNLNISEAVLEIVKIISAKKKKELKMKRESPLPDFEKWKEKIAPNFVDLQKVLRYQDGSIFSTVDDMAGFLSAFSEVKKNDPAVEVSCRREFIGREFLFGEVKVLVDDDFVCFSLVGDKKDVNLGINTFVYCDDELVVKLP